MTSDSSSRNPAMDHFWRGARACIPICISVAAYGVVWGVLAGQAGMTLAEVVLMSGIVLAGASQFVAADLWTPTPPLPVGAIIIATLIVNLRLMLMSATLRPIFAGWPAWRAALATFFVSDESWALTMGEIDKRQKRDPFLIGSGEPHGALHGTAAFLIGAGVATWVSWFLSTVIGRILGSGIDDPSRYGLDFAFTATFLALLLGSWKGRQDLVPWIVGGLAAVIVQQLLPQSQWHILAGGLVGSFAGAVVDTRRAANAA
jgi:predicted branched-subunit amino acid permease